MTDISALLTPADVARVLSISQRTVRTLVETRRIAFIDIGTMKRSVYRFKAQDIETFVEASHVPALATAMTPLRMNKTVALSGKLVAQPVDFLAILEERKRNEKAKKKPARR